VPFLTVSLRGFAAPTVATSPGLRIGHVSYGTGHSEESVMSGRLWYRDSYGRWHEDRHAEVRAGMPTKWALMALMVLAGFVVIASLIH